MARPQTSSDPRDLKRKLSPHILRLPGVSGIGIPKGRLTIYLEEDSEETKSRVKDVLKKVTPEVDVVFMVTGKFSKRSTD